MADALRDRYTIERELGSGGMATVYLARDLRHDRLVALKVLHPELARTLGPERFLREIHTTAQLDHPHILPVFDSGEAHGLLWYTMPYVEGESLRERLRREGQLPLDDALRIAREVADALDCAHEHGVVHRDIKPENILLARGHARVADFGVARALEAAGGSQLTQTGLVVGTPAYMSPEQAGAGQVDARTDVYALGCVLYEMLAGEPPYSGPTPQAIIAKRLTDPVPSARRLREGVPAWLDGVIGKALAKLPADRFQTAAEFAEALEARVGSEPAPAVSTAAIPIPGSPLSRSTAPWPNPRFALTLGLGLLIAVIMLLWVWGYYKGGLTSRPAAGPRAAESAGGPIRPATALQPSVAVLPFTNLSPERENEYFSDGMTEELITALGKVPGLRVAARTSAFAFKGKNADVREIGHALNVGTVVEGSVRRAGHRLRVTAQLINVADGYHLWADEYDRELRDVFRVQDELARAIVGALRVPLKLSDRLDSALVKVGTADPEVHDLYLQGRIFWNQRTYESLLTAVRYFERALARDSAYAEAYAALADAYVIFPDYGVSVPREAYPRAKAAAVRALALDSTLGYAHATLGVVRETYEWDWNGAEQEFLRAIALDPSYATAHQWYAEYLSSLGRHEEALAEAERAVTLDPLSRIIRVDKASVLLGSRRYDEAIAEVRETLALDPDFVQAHIMLGQAYLAKGMHAEAVTELETVARLSGRHAGLGRLACAYALSGQRDKARELIRELTERSRHEYVSPFHFAIAYTGLRDKEQALAWLERMADTREPSVPSLGTDPYWDPLRSDPRFTRLLKRVGLQ